MLIDIPQMRKTADARSWQTRRLMLRIICFCFIRVKTIEAAGWRALRPETAFRIFDKSAYARLDRGR